MRYSPFVIVSFTAAIGGATPVNQSEPAPRAVVEGGCYVGANSVTANGICYENYPARSGWTGNCDPHPWECRANGNWCSISTSPGGVVMCT
ncbi:hypothetical protein F4820DRAFT_27057 [Hypoxylon rubiginosum]|uniref:Uncharacterized protein n=1 Tax=Hypoxylon rubiginosum TaxID=110542 RepID=A0ACB9YSC3_9PEZI|nr:hypothetical protein F4820DRAFT_27057 [Hypoxylon rubiginosum]